MNATLKVSKAFCQTQTRCVRPRLDHQTLNSVHFRETRGHAQFYEQGTPAIIRLIPPLVKPSRCDRLLARHLLADDRLSGISRAKQQAVLLTYQDQYPSKWPWRCIRGKTE